MGKNKKLSDKFTAQDEKYSELIANGEQKLLELGKLSGITQLFEGLAKEKEAYQKIPETINNWKEIINANEKQINKRETLKQEALESKNNDEVKVQEKEISYLEKSTSRAKEAIHTQATLMTNLEKSLGKLEVLAKKIFTNSISAEKNPYVSKYLSLTQDIQKAKKDQSNLRDINQIREVAEVRRDEIKGKNPKKTQSEMNIIEFRDAKRNALRAQLKSLEINYVVYSAKINNINTDENKTDIANFKNALREGAQNLIAAEQADIKTQYETAEFKNFSATKTKVAAENHQARSMITKINKELGLIDLAIAKAPIQRQLGEIDHQSSKISKNSLGQEALPDAKKELDEKKKVLEQQLHDIVKAEKKILNDKDNVLIQLKAKAVAVESSLEVANAVNTTYAAKKHEQKNFQPIKFLDSIEPMFFATVSDQRPMRQLISDIKDLEVPIANASATNKEIARDFERYIAAKESNLNNSAIPPSVMLNNFVEEKKVTEPTVTFEINQTTPFTAGVEENWAEAVEFNEQSNSYSEIPSETKDFYEKEDSEILFEDYEDDELGFTIHSEEEKMTAEQVERPDTSNLSDLEAAFIEQDIKFSKAVYHPAQMNAESRLEGLTIASQLLQDKASLQESATAEVSHQIGVRNG